MSTKSKTLIQAVADASFAMGKVIEQQDNGEVINGSLAVYREAAAITALEDYIATLHTRITSLHTANNNQAEMLGELATRISVQARTLAKWAERRVNAGLLVKLSPDPEVDVGPGSSPVPDTYQGHAGTTGGLQQHSIGELYPCIIAKVGDVWQVDHSSLGFLANGFNTQAEAVAWAKNFKEQDR